MKIVALFVALILERLFTHLFRWRELRWLDPVFDVGLRNSKRLAAVSPYLWVILVLLLCVLPVVIARLAFDDTLLGLPYLALSVVVLFLSLGPQDIGQDVDQWCAALRDGHTETERVYARALLEREYHDSETAREAVPSAVFVQANNRMFAVIFWFVLLGPIGAWLFRVADLARRRALFQAQRDDPAAAVATDCEQRADDVHALLAYLPARLSALGFLLAGHYDAGVNAWRQPDNTAQTLSQRNDNLLRRVGNAAMQLIRGADEADIDWHSRAAKAAKNLALRTLMFWLVGVALLTLVGAAI
ncbi:MAG: regulatory signaling modulator protein AmpE [Pseudomonadota bacterium]